MNAAFIDMMLSQLIGTIGGRWQFLHRRQMKVKVGVIRPIRPTAILGNLCLSPVTDSQETAIWPVSW
jgi:hypothetical protein